MAIWAVNQHVEVLSRAVLLYIMLYIHFTFKQVKQFKNTHKKAKHSGSYSRYLLFLLPLSECSGQITYLSLFMFKEHGEGQGSISNLCRLSVCGYSDLRSLCGYLKCSNQ